MQHFRIIKAYLAKKSTVTLWHGTIKDNLQSIKENWLTPGTGAFTEAHRAEYDDENMAYGEAVFLADKRRLNMSIGAMVQALRKKLDKWDITEEDIEQHGLLVKVKGEGGKAVSPIEYRPTDDEMDADPSWKKKEYYADYPSSSVEPGDHFSREEVEPTQFFTGKKLIRLLKKYNAWPANNLAPSPKRRKTLLDLLRKLDKDNLTVEELRQRVSGMSDSEVETKIQEIRKTLGLGRSLRLEADW